MSDSNLHHAIDTTVSQTNALPTELIRSALSEGILYYFNDQLGEAWLVRTHARIDEITSIQRALNILERALSRCPALVQMSRLKAPVRLERNLRYLSLFSTGLFHFFRFQLKSDRKEKITETWHL